jgi:hypothetical protein
MRIGTDFGWRDLQTIPVTSMCTRLNAWNSTAVQALFKPGSKVLLERSLNSATQKRWIRQDRSGHPFTPIQWTPRGSRNFKLIKVENKDFAGPFLEWRQALCDAISKDKITFRFCNVNGLSLCYALTKRWEDRQIWPTFTTIIHSTSLSWTIHTTTNLGSLKEQGFQDLQLLTVLVSLISWDCSHPLLQLGHPRKWKVTQFYTPVFQPKTYPQA